MSKIKQLHTVGESTFKNKGDVVESMRNNNNNTGCNINELISGIFLVIFYEKMFISTCVLTCFVFEKQAVKVLIKN